jgi:very-short-patch-repair endonuclease
VIAGDSKQMPPSDFFASSESSDSDWYDEDEIDEDDAPPVTTEHRLIAAAGEYCLLDAAENSLPKGAAAQRMLEIHYRSAAKELIEFSNHAFYDGKLQAPPGNPSADVMFNRPIRYQKVQGQFKSGINRIEATQIVNFLKELWKIPDSPSVGVIVFNMKQKGELEQQIEELASHEEAFKERWLNERERMHEGEDVGFFVRSVEHVQGDERELIILGTTYAGDSRNFGPLTKKDKGRKRLNVAITRAKRGMLVFSSLNLNAMASDAGSDKEGWFLQQFLRYAKAVSDNDSGSMNAVLNAVNPARTQEQREQQFDSPFEQDVAEFLAQHNYTVDTQIGESGFRIDLGVRRTQGGGYLCGIECDGAQYHSGWRARTNDIWRQRILESKGWEIIRIWSTDWFNDLEKEKRRVLHEINACSEEMKKSMQSLEDILAMASGAEQLPLIEKYVHPTIMPTKQAELGALEIPIFGDLFSVTSQMPLNDAESKILFVEVGDTVTYCDTHHVDEKIQVQITSGRSNFDQGIINQSAPLAGILIDAVVGEEVELRLPGKSPCVLRILKIERVKC